MSTNAIRCARYRALHRERVLQSQSNYYAHNRDKVLAGIKAWRKENRERHLEMDRLWREANPARKAALGAKRRASIRRAIPLWVDFDAVKVLYEQAAALTSTTGVPHVVDHVVPLTNPNVCGLHWHGNLQVLTAQANGEKHNKF